MTPDSGLRVASVTGLNAVVTCALVESVPMTAKRGTMTTPALSEVRSSESKGARLFMRSLLAVAVAILIWTSPGAADDEVWTFDRLDRIGGHPTTMLGNPRVIDTPVGKAIAFDGVDDALVVDVHPLAGAETFTWEAIFRPDGGAAAQRWFHLQESGSDNRMLFEIRVIEDRWCLDAFAKSGAVEKALLNRQRLHPLGAWYHVAAVYDTSTRRGGTC